MNVSEFDKNTDIKDILIQMSDKISELDRLIVNINVLSEEVYTCLVSQAEPETERECVMAIRNSEVPAIKAGMIREFVIRANEKVSNLMKLSDKCISFIK